MAKNIRPKNNQDAFDIALNGIRKQNYKISTTKEGSCAYRGENGLRCALGHMIPNKLYKSGMEGLVPDHSLLRDFPELGVYLENVDVELLTDLQCAHDSYLGYNKFDYDYENKMKQIAKNWGLTYEQPK